MAQEHKDHKDFATSNFTKSGASGLYDRARPTYPAQAHAQILDLLPPSARGAHVVELGSGTGLFTRGFLQAALECEKEDRGAEGGKRVARLTAVEPSEGMREGFSKGLEKEGLVGSSIEVSCVDGAFDKVPVGDGEADLAWHWTGTSQTSADRNVGWVAGLRDAYEQFESDTPQYRHGLWKKMYEEQEYHDLFTEPSHAQFHRALPTTEALAVDRVFSKSYITALSDSERSSLEQRLRETIRRGEGREWIDEEQAIFAYPYGTDLFVAKRK
ncbi:hypothetical protein JCM8208_003790 [Rhodotorula glutinis]